MLEDFGDMLPHTVLIAPKTGADRFNHPTYGADTTRKALVVEKVQMVRSHNGEEVVSNTEVYLDGPGGASLAPESRITLPSGKTPPILSISTYPDEHGDYVSIVYL